MLPNYAQPVFIRLRTQQEVTGTFKYKKTDLKNESYLPNAAEEIILVKHPIMNSYTTLDNNAIDAIEQKLLSF